MSAKSFKLRNDPVTFEVLRHRLWQINDEQGQTIIRVSGSPVASEGNDFNVAITDAQGELIAVGPYIVMHVAAITCVIQETVKLLGQDGIEEGDIYLVNDSWMGAGHQNDFCVVQPVFWEGRVIGWTASVIHMVDVGGPVPGSWNFAAKNTFEEAPRYKGLRVVRAFKVQPEVVATVLTNSRLPDQLELDLRAQIAAANVARERLFELIRRYGIETVEDAFADMLDYAQSVFRQKLETLPDGSWYAEDFLDHDGHQERNYAIRCRLTKSGDRLHFDFTGTSGQSPGLINSTYAGAVAGVFSAVFPLLCGKMPWNSGVTRQIDLTIEEGTIHHARFPAPVGYGVVHASWTTMNCAAHTLSKMLAAQPGSTEPMAGWAGAAFVYNIFGETDGKDRFATMLLSSDLQGTGARAFGDGYDVGGKLNAPRGKVTNVESVESDYPLLFLYRRQACDSGGPGRWRGGTSGESCLTTHGAQEVHFTVNTVGTAHTSTPGLNGGYPGGGATVMVVTGSNLALSWEQGRLPQSVEEIGGQVKMLSSKQVFVLRPGDVFLAVPHGGGGVGDPILRDPARVVADVVRRRVSRDWAERIYGVVLDDDGNPVEGATVGRRAEIRRERLGGLAGDRARHLVLPPSAGVFDPLVIEGRKIVCGQCGGTVCASDEDPKDHLRRNVLEIGEAGPWVARRWQGKSPEMRLWSYVCVDCGGSIRVEQHLKADIEGWRDSFRQTADAMAEPAYDKENA